MTYREAFMTEVRHRLYAPFHITRLLGIMGRRNVLNRPSMRLQFQVPRRFAQLFSIGAEVKQIVLHLHFLKGTRRCNLNSPAPSNPKFFTCRNDKPGPDGPGDDGPRSSQIALP